MSPEVEQGGPVAIVRGGNPTSRSRWSPATESALFDRLAEAEADPGVRVIVLAGSTDDFCAGPEPDALSADTARDPRGDQFPRSISKPVIAAVDGACHGIGLSLALMCDLRVVSSTTRISAGFASFGLVAEHGIAWLLQRICGHGAAADLLLTDRRIDGREAWRLGVAQYFTEETSALEHAVSLAEEMVRGLSPLSLAVIKRQLVHDSALELDEAVARGEHLVQRVVGAGDFQRLVDAFSRGEHVECAALDPIVVQQVWAD